MHIEQLYAGKRSDDLLPPGFKGEPTTPSWNRYYESISFMDEQMTRQCDDRDDRSPTKVTTTNRTLMNHSGCSRRGMSWHMRRADTR